MASRIEVVTLCDRCGESHPGASITDVGCFGDGGSRRTLTEGEYVLIEKVVINPDVKEWPDKVLLALEGKHWTGIAETLDALAGGES